MIKKSLADIFNRRDFEARENFTPDELSTIGEIRKNLYEQKQELFEIRKELNKNMERLDAWIKFFNIYAVPLLIVLIWLVKWYLCSRGSCNKIIWYFKFNRQLVLLAGASLLVMVFGIWSYYMRWYESTDDPHSQELFEGLIDKINQVSNIIIKNHDSELVLQKDNGVWRNKQQPQFLVSQNRVKSFLNDLLEARIYEKKSDRVEVMQNFGIRSLDDEASPTVEIALLNKNKEQILGFAVGDYNIELSRGAVGAYIKLPDQFQVWLAKVDFVDLNPDYHNWSFANLWDLQLGRIGSINNSHDKNFIAKVVSLLLNVQMTEAVKYIGYENLKMSLDMKGEYFDKLVMDFYEEDEKYYVHYYFEGIKKHDVLQKFANKMKDYYEISKDDMEKISRAVEQK